LAQNDDAYVDIKNESTIREDVFECLGVHHVLHSTEIDNSCSVSQEKKQWGHGSTNGPCSDTTPSVTPPSVMRQTLPFGSWSHPLERFSPFDSGVNAVVLRTERDSGSIERVGKMCERTCMRLGITMESEVEGGKFEMVRDGGSTGGLLDRLTMNFMSCSNRYLISKD
jgi:hypothetical protein